MRTFKINGKTRKYLLIAAIALMLISVVALADVIYYYKGVITASVSQAPLTFYSGKNFTYTTPTGTTCTVPLNSYAGNYANFTATSQGFTAKIQLTNASYTYFYHALGLLANTPGWIYITNVTISGTPIIEQLTIVIQNAYTGQSVCSFTIIANAEPIQGTTNACALNTGPYLISVIAQPIASLSTGESETVTLYFGYNIMSNATVPLPPISG
ncbi:MAG: hypothetical protein ACP5GZ_01780 [Vulcanisaeta sp.]|jgi:hypothetical protein|uniref:Uncharacterized protein n=1 Tax=Vulcanisaeta moutnovskia (strain 768-28) TaxID=985053 RepID=F0QX85_VULM7|nr:hypothetical protein [Vulcanisaeta moutnovskia]ADY02374.1 hypothetical protein VMUT_2178 [Vulcanisaeta moutnovskia 768-28]